MYKIEDQIVHIDSSGASSEVVNTEPLKSALDRLEKLNKKHIDYKEFSSTMDAIDEGCEYFLYKLIKGESQVTFIDTDKDIISKVKSWLQQELIKNQAIPKKDWMDGKSEGALVFSVMKKFDLYGIIKEIAPIDLLCLLDAYQKFESIRIKANWEGRSDSSQISKEELYKIAVNILGNEDNQHVIELLKIEYDVKDTEKSQLLLNTEPKTYILPTTKSNNVGVTVTNSQGAPSSVSISDFEKSAVKPLQDIMATIGWSPAGSTQQNMYKGETDHYIEGTDLQGADSLEG